MALFITVRRKSQTCARQQSKPQTFRTTRERLAAAGDTVGEETRYVTRMYTKSYVHKAFLIEF